MLKLKNRRDGIPDGFQFRQKETGWYLKTWDFESLCRELLKHRQANPQLGLSTNMNVIRDEVDHANAVRVLSYRGGETYVTTGAIELSNIPKLVLPRLLKSPAGSAGAKTVSGAFVLGEWFGEGGLPVAKDVSEERARICSVCEKNQADTGSILEWFTKKASEMIRHAFELRAEIGLTTSHDDKLEVCSACTCPLKLKVHTPIKHILDHTSDEDKAELDPGCWILSESAAESQ